MIHVHLYTDGACSGNPGPGGWAAILVAPNGTERELVGGAKHTTNNKMELTSVIEGLRKLNRPCRVTITTDSRYVIDAFEKNWFAGWKRRAVNGVWMTSNNKPVKNQELWEQLLAEVARHEVDWVWVRGHNEHPYNERCDALAVDFYRTKL